MRFEDLLKKYKDGTATAEERAAVEEELEKVRLIEEYLAEEEAVLPLPEVNSAGEVKAVQRTITRRTRRTALAVVAGVLALLALLQFVLLPLANGRIYDEPDYGNGEISQYSLFMDTYTQLYMPMYLYYGTDKQTSGFGRWTLTNGFRSVDRTYITPEFTVTAGTLDFGADAELFYQMFPAVNLVHISDSYQRNGHGYVDNALRRLDDCINVTAAVSFNRELTLEELMAFTAQWQDSLDIFSAVLWRQDHRPIHLSLRGSSIGWGESVNEDYPFLFLELPQHADAATLQQHLESQLQFIIDHEYLLNKLDNHSDPSALLDDLRRTGARFKGIWVTGTGEELLHLYESGLVGDIEPQEAHIALYG